MKQIILVVLLLANGFSLAEETPWKGWWKDEPSWWSKQKTPEHIYRVVKIDYSADMDDEEMTFHYLSPPGWSLESCYTCRMQGRGGIRTWRPVWKS